MTPIEIMALIVAVLGGLKLIIILIDPKIWLNKVVKNLYCSSATAMIIGLVITGVSLYYLLKVMSIVNIFAVMLFFMGLMLMAFAAYTKDTLALAGKMLKDKTVIRKAWLVTIIWIALLAWVLYALFA